MPKQIHEDFGEKIGGAKKDLWSVRGLYTDDLDEMNEREAEKYVKKDNIWKKPDFAPVTVWKSNCRPTLPSTGTDTGSVSVTVAAYPSAAETDGA